MSIQDVAKAITGTRYDFGRAFLQAQIAADIAAADRKEFEAIANSFPTNEQAFLQGLRYAQQKNWYEALVDTIIANRLDDGSIAQEIAKADPGAPLQAMIDNFHGFMEANRVVRGLAQASRWTGKISVKGVPSGTGLLVSNNWMLTAWHVVKDLFDPDANGLHQPVPNGGDLLEVVFSDFMEAIGRGTSLPGAGERRVKGDKDWCVFFSRCHDDELDKRLPTPLEDLTGFWDYAIIRLAEPIGFERGWVTPSEKAVVPKPKDQVVLFQHPGGRAMKLVFDDIAEPLPQQQTVIPRLRFLHLLNTLPGSSGGPCFDRTMEFFGFHQGVWDGANPLTNRGVPLAGVLEHLKTNYGVTKLEPEDSLIWKLDADKVTDKKEAPVIGCEEFQNLVLGSSIRGKPRIFTVRGDPGRGKTFHTSLVSALLPDVTNMKIQLSAQAIATTKSAPDLANMISTKAGAGELQIDPPSEVFSTFAVWLKDEVTRKLMEAIDRVRNDRMVWLIITDLNSFNLGEEETTALLLLIYEQVRTYSWLRIVLDGLKSDIPGGLSDYEHRHTVTNITQNQIETYLLRLANFLGLNAAAGFVAYPAVELFQLYDKEVGVNSANAARLLAETIKNRTIPVFYGMQKRFQP